MGNELSMNENKRPSLTIGLSFFNNQATLANAIKSVLLQTFDQWELILIDDGSTDNSYKVAKQYADSDSRITLLSDGKNKGLINRLNQIIDLAGADYIARMDSDDMMLPEKLEKQMSVLAQNKDIDVIDTAVYTMNERDEPVGIRRVEDIKGWTKRNILRNTLLYHPTIIAKTSWYKQNKYKEGYIRAEDFELWCRTFDNTIFSRIEEPLFIYREGNVNINNYTTSNKTSRKIIRNYGPGVLTQQEILAELLKSHLKSTLYRLFALFNLQYMLSSRRNDKLSSSQVEMLKGIIQHIKDHK